MIHMMTQKLRNYFLGIFGGLNLLLILYRVTDLGHEAEDNLVYQMNFSVFRPDRHSHQRAHQHICDVTSDDVTIVTAYVNIDAFSKGSEDQVFKPDLYRTWMKIFSNLANPLVVFLEDGDDVTLFRKLRHDYVTRIVTFRRNETWAWSLRERISEIYANPRYPKHLPNTVVPEYTCAMHAKYEFMAAVAESNPFCTRYTAWLDIGYFRDLLIDAKNKNKKFQLGLPPKFNDSRIAYTEVFPRSVARQPRGIFHGNHVWLGGGYFVGAVDVMRKWTDLYKNNTEYYLSWGLSDTDQQVLYSIFNQNRTSLDRIQIYKGGWFHLGYISMI